MAMPDQGVLSPECLSSNVSYLEKVMSCNRSLSTLGAVLLAIGGTILAAVPSALAQYSYKTLYRFRGRSDGGSPNAGLIFDQAGNLYGTTAFGGDHGACPDHRGCGIVFELTPTSDGSWTESALHTFCFSMGCSDGAYPFASMIFDATGNLYGTTYAGGIDGVGVVYQLTPSNMGWTESVLHSFTGYRDGGYPSSSLILDKSGALYGTSSSYGLHSDGTVFKLTSTFGGTWTEDPLYNFAGGKDGGNSYAGVIPDSEGNLYGFTSLGGRDNAGVVFGLKDVKDSWTISVLHSFTAGRDGGIPYYGNLIVDRAGDLYGTTSIGGLYGFGTVFKLTWSGGQWRETVLHSFANGDGARPLSGLIFDPEGNLYGTTSQGGDLSLCSGQGCGVVFKLTPNSSGGWKEKVLHVFVDDPGADSAAGLTLDSKGNLYGTTLGDAKRDFGSVFEITP